MQGSKYVINKEKDIHAYSKRKFKVTKPYLFSDIHSCLSKREIHYLIVTNTHCGQRDSILFVNQRKRQLLIFLARCFHQYVYLLCQFLCFNKTIIQDSFVQEILRMCQERCNTMVSNHERLIFLFWSVTFYATTANFFLTKIKISY